MLAETKLPDATPGIIEKFALNDEQAILAKIRYNRLIDIFTGITCYSLQSHLRTNVPSLGQVETDEIYIGLDKRGAQYVFPVQAKGPREKLGIVQIDQDFELCATKFPELNYYRLKPEDLGRLTRSTGWNPALAAACKDKKPAPLGHTKVFA